MNKTVVNISVLMFLYLAAASAQSQWQQMSFLSNNIRCFAKDSANLFAGATTHVYVSTTSGTSWVDKSSGLPSGIYGIESIISDGVFLFAGFSGSGIYRSTNSGGQWEAVNSGLTNMYVYSLYKSGTNIYAGTSTTGGVFISTNDGSSWAAANSGLSTSTAITAFCSNDNFLFAGTAGSGIFRSSNNGASWTFSGSGVSVNNWIRSLYADNSKIIAGTSSNTGTGGVFLSTDEGQSWTSISGGFMSGNGVLSTVVLSENIFAATANGIMASTNTGVNWAYINEGMISTAANRLISKDNFLFTDITNNGIWRRPVSEVTPVSVNTSVTPFYFALYQNYPNPFNPVTVIDYQISAASKVTLKVFELSGKEILTAFEGFRSAGNYSQKLDCSGWSSGIYFYTLNSGEHSLTRKMAVVK